MRKFHPFAQFRMVTDFVVQIDGSMPDPTSPLRQSARQPFAVGSERVRVGRRYHEYCLPRRAACGEVCWIGRRRPVRPAEKGLSSNLAAPFKNGKVQSPAYWTFRTAPGQLQAQVKERVVV